MDVCFLLLFFLVKCWSTWLSMRLAKDWILSLLCRNKENICKVLIICSISFLSGHLLVHQRLYRNNHHCHHWRLLSQLCYNFCTRRWRLHSYNISMNIGNVVVSKSSSIRFGWTERRPSISSGNSRKGSSSSTMAVFWLSLNIPGFRNSRPFASIVHPKLRLTFAFLAATKFLEMFSSSLHFQ